MQIEPSLNVLVAEDNPTNLQVISTMLEVFGCRVMVANDGREAVSSAIENLPDVILMDINMPNKDGVQAAVCLRKRMPESRIPIVAVTGNVTSQTRKRCEEAGFEGFIEKPVDIMLLNKTLQGLASNR